MTYPRNAGANIKILTRIHSMILGSKRKLKLEKELHCGPLSHKAATPPAAPSAISDSLLKYNSITQLL